MKTFREYINEKNETIALEVGEYVCNIFSGDKNTPVEVSKANGDFTEITKGSAYDMIMKLWKSGDEMDWHDFKDEYGTPDFDSDKVIVDVDKSKLSKLEKELDKLDYE